MSPDSGVDFHNQEPPETVVVVRNKCLVEAINNGNVIGKAVRSDNEHDWHIGLIVAGKMYEVAVIYNWTPEVQARKMILALLGTV